MELAEEKSMRKQGIWGLSILALGPWTLASLQAQTIQPQPGVQTQTIQSQAGGPGQAMRHQKGDLPGPIDSLSDLEDTGRMLFMMADANRDGQISQQEAINAANLCVGGFFFQADGNGDGVVSPEEARRARENFLQTRPWLRYVIETARATPKPGQAGQPGSAQQSPLRMLQTVFDSNNDRQLQASELRQGVQTVVQGMFTTADTNRDNQLSPTEVNGAIDGMFASAAQAAYQAADTDHNGSLSLQLGSVHPGPGPRGVQCPRRQPRWSAHPRRGRTGGTDHHLAASVASHPQCSQFALEPDPDGTPPE